MRQFNIEYEEFVEESVVLVLGAIGTPRLLKGGSELDIITNMRALQTNLYGIKCGERR